MPRIQNRSGAPRAKSLPAAILTHAGALLLTSLLAQGLLFAQAPGAREPPAPAAAPGAISINDVCAQAVPPDAQGNQFAWSPNNKSLAFFKSLPSGFGLRLELDLVDATGDHRAVLLRQQQIDQLFPAVPQGFKQEFVPPPRQSVGFEWSADSRSLLLHSNTGIVLLDRETGATRSLVAGKEPISDVQLSPDGRAAAFVRDHNLWILSIASGTAREVTQGGNPTLRKGELDWIYPAELGTHHGYAWSPDSSHIAYLEFNLQGVPTYTPPFPSTNGDPVETIDYPTPRTSIPVVKVFVLKLNEKSSSPPVPLPVDTGSAADSYLPRLQWLPDSKRLALQRLNRAQNKLDLLLADAATGATRVLITESDDYWINLSNTLAFLKNSPQFLWSSERSGYRQLYLYDLDGKLVRQLTDGKWEVTSLDAVDEAAQTVYYTSTEKSPIERQLYVAALNRSALPSQPSQRITRDSGTHEVTFSPDAAAFVDNFSTAIRPWSQSLYRLDSPSSAGGIRPNTPAIKLFPLIGPQDSATRPALRQVDFFTVKTHDGVDMNAMMLRPATLISDKKYPAIVYVRGGPRQQAVSDRWQGDVSMWQQMLVQQGFVVFAVDNRGTGGRGHLFEEYVHLRFAAQESTDLRDAVRFLQALPYIDPARTAIWGRGFGGALAVSAMLHRPLLFKAAFAVAPIVDWLHMDSAFVERYLGDSRQNQDGYLSSSPLDNAATLKGSLLVAQGTGDLEVHADQAMELQSALVDAHKYAEISLFPGESSTLDHPAACAVMYQHATDLFLKDL